MPYLAVDDVDARAKKATKAGATLMRPLFDIPGIGRIAILRYPGGAGVGWLTPATASVRRGAEGGNCSSAPLYSRSRVELIMQHKASFGDEWVAARKADLADEKAFTKGRDRLSAERRALPWVKVEKNYVFDAPEGKKSLGDLFDGRNQLIVYHF